MKLTKKENKFIKDNREVLDSIFRKKMNSMMDDLFEMPMSQERQAHLQALKIFRVELKKMELMRNDKNNSERVKFI